jgi:hypothetical protein
LTLIAGHRRLAGGTAAGALRRPCDPVPQIAWSSPADRRRNRSSGSLALGGKGAKAVSSCMLHLS